MTKSKPKSSSKRRKVSVEFASHPESEWRKKWKASEQRKGKKLLDDAVAAIAELPTTAFDDFRRARSMTRKTRLEDLVGKETLMKTIAEDRQRLYTILSLSDKQIAQYVWRVGHLMLGVRNKSKSPVSSRARRSARAS